MRNINAVLGVLLLLSVGACESQDQGTEGSKTVSSEEVKQKAAAAVKAFTDFAKQRNDEFRKQMEAQLADLDQKIRELNQKVADLGAEASQELKDMVDKMGRQSETARKQLGELTSATGKSVEELKDNINKEVKELEKSYEKADSSTQ